MPAQRRDLLVVATILDDQVASEYLLLAYCHKLQSPSARYVLTCKAIHAQGLFPIAREEKSFKLSK